MAFRKSSIPALVTAEPTSSVLAAQCRLGQRFFVVGLSFAWTLAAPAAWNIACAQSEAPPAPRSAVVDTTADRYFFDAKAKAAQKQWVEALVLFEKAWEIKPSHDIAGNLGQVALKLGRYKKAAIFLERCLRLFPPTGNPEQRAQIQTLFESARGHVTLVQIHVGSQVGELVLDRAAVIGPAAKLTEPVFVDPGTHVLQLRRDGQVLAETSFLAIANASQDVTLATSEEDASKASDTLPKRHPPGEHEEAGKSRMASHAGNPQGRSVWPAVIGATISVASLVSAGGLIASANSQVSEADDIKRNRLSNVAPNFCAVNAGNADCYNLHAANERADTRYNWGHAMLGVGSVSLLATAAYVLWPHSNESVQTSRQSLRLPSVSLDVRPGASTFTLQCRF